MSTPASETQARLQKNLQEVIASPTEVQLDEKLVDTLRAQITVETSRNVLPTLLPLLTGALAVSSNPQSLTSLLLKLLEPVQFSELLQLTTPQQLLPTLESPSPTIQIMGLKLLQKAADSSADAATLAGSAELVSEIVKLALMGSNIEVAELAGNVLIELLTVDRAGPGGVGEGLTWRRLFGDKGIYSSIFKICSPKSKVPTLNRSEKTLAQARLLALVPRMADLNWDMVWKSHFVDVESSYEGDGSSGLLGFANNMVELDNDVLLHMTVIDFYANLILCSPTPQLEKGEEKKVYPTSKGLEYLVESGKHSSTISLYTTPTDEQTDQFTAAFLLSRAARYVAVYAAHFPSHLQATDGLMQKILVAVKSYLPPQAGREVHSPSLHLLSSLPPSELLDVINHVPLSPPHPDYLSTLGTLLPQDEPLYREYISHNQQLYKKLAEYASITALKESALASLQVLQNLAGCDYGLRDLVSTTSVMEFLMTVPQRYTVNVGHGGEQGAAFMIAHKRWEVVEVIAKGLATGSESDERLAAARKAWGQVLEERVAGGAWGGIAASRAGAAVGWEGM